VCYFSDIGALEACFQHSFRTAVPTVTLTLSYKDFGAQSMALGLGSVGLVGFRVRAKVGLGA